MTKKLTTFVISILCIYSNAFSQLHINEVMSSNGLTIADEMGEFDDWIEIYNSSNEAINLAGYYISDDTANLNAYQIPANDESKTSVPANGYALLWADKDEEQGVHHLGIKLSAGETIILTQPDGSTIVDSLTIPSTLQEDESYGNQTDGNSNVMKVFSQATPFESNNNSNEVDIIISHPSKLFTNSLAVEVNSDGINGTLKYTTNGSIPTSSSPTYTSPITINSNTTLKVAYVFNNGDVSNVQTERYVKMTNGMSNANSDLPLVLIETYGQTLDQETMKPVFMSVVEPNNNGRAYGGDEASFTGKAAMKIRGSSSASFPKKQWRVELRNEDDSDRKESLLGMPADGDWVLYAPGQYDRALINNALMYEVSNQLGYYAPRTRFVEVYYNDNGGNLNDTDYWGIYILVEKIEVNNDRVDIAKLNSDENTGEDLTGGYLLSLDRDPSFTTNYTSTVYNWNTPPGYRVRTPDMDEISTTQFGYIQDEINKFENALTSQNWLDENLGYKSFTDIESWVGPHIIKTLAKEPDGFFLSHYIIKDKNDVIKGGPVWDFDRALNSPDTRSKNYFGWDTDYLNNPNTGNVYYWEGSYKAGAYLKEMTADPCYKTLFYDKWFTWRSDNILNINAMNQLIDSLANKLTESYAREYDRWSGEGYTPRYGSFQGEVDALKTWLKNRSEWIDDELIKQVTYSPNAGNVNLGQSISLTNPNNTGTIYYTTDGSDPKQDCSNIANTATAYNGSINIDIPGFTYIFTRIKIGDEWGPLNIQGYYVNQDYEGLVINEIHYNPNDEMINGEMVDGDNFEFIEIKNTSSNNINIAGIQFNLGIGGQVLNNTILEPNSYCVFAENAEWFEQKYGFAPTGVYSGKLSNGGEEVMLTDPFDNPIDVVEYDDKLPWDPIADEGQYSLGLLDAILDNNEGFNWSIQSANTTPNTENAFCFGDDTDGDGICDDNDQCPNEDDTIIGTNCDDGDVCTANDVYNSSCDCVGTYADSDGDGICNNNDVCPNDALDLCNLPQYCDSKGNNTNYEYIRSITVGDLSNTSGKNDGYADFTPMGASLTIGETYAVNLVPEFPGQAYNEYWKIWIDFNRDGDFEDGNETVFAGSGSSTVTGEITIPADVQIGPTKLRITMDYSNSPTTCGSFTYGEVEDYIAFIKAACIIGNACDDGDVCTINDVFDDNCNCNGIEQDSDNDSVCDAEDICQDFDDALIGAACDDEDDCTINDTVKDDCTCAGIFVDEDEDTICDANDICADGDDNIDGDNDGIPDACDTCNANIIGNPCDDGDACTTDETYDGACNCVNGQIEDADLDGVCDAEDICENGDDNQDIDSDGIPDACDGCNTTGNSCDDEDVCTTNDVLDIDCNCAGVFEDGDNDGICNAEDNCDGDNNLDADNDGVPDACDTCNNNLVGTFCDDGDACTTGETYDADCNCNGGNLVDSDNDTVCDNIDICEGDDLQDEDNDGLPDACDECPNDNTNACGTPTYCDAKGNNTNYEYIQKVNFKTIDNNSGNNGGYADFSQQTTTVSTGESVPFSLTPGFSSSTYNEAWTIWIDFNRDGDFEDAGENVYSNVGNGALSGNINIPGAANTGATGIRIAMQWKNAATPCGSFTYGEVEDYTIIITDGGAPKLVNGLGQNTIKVFPNPAVKEINIDLSNIIDQVENQNINIHIYTLNGRLIFQQISATTGIINLNIEQLPDNQPYLLQVQTKSGDQYAEKFIKL